MSKAKAIVIDFKALTDQEQLSLIWNLVDWSNKELPADKLLPLYLVLKKIKKGDSSC